MVQMGQMLPLQVQEARGAKWFHRSTPAMGEIRNTQSRRKAQELLSSTLDVLHRHDLSIGAKLLYCALRTQDERVVCIDPQEVADKVGVRPERVHGCLDELTRTGVVADRIGNLLFFN